VDEWLYLLAQVIERQWPNISLMRPSFSMVVSHDVDSPSRYAFATPQQLAARALGDLKRGEWYSATMAPWIRYGSSKRLHSADPANTFDWIMDLSEQHGLVSAFYFIGGQTHPPTDPDYQLEHPLIRQLLKRIHTRGHEIGLHPSYNTYLWPDRVRQEAERLKRVCSQENVGQLNFGGRMHYLRWRCPDTMLAADSAGMAYDCTLTYADRPGFRCGTSREYQAFDPVAKRELSLRIRPLVVMEKSVIATPYLGLGESVSALTKFISLKETCRKVGSPFSLLWHNTTLRRKQRSLYTAVLDSR
jgi:hypothetical protein